MITEAAPSSAQDCQAPELMLVGQAVPLEALEALEALALRLSSTLGLISLALEAARRLLSRRSRRWRSCSAARWA